MRVLRKRVVDFLLPLVLAPIWNQPDSRLGSVAEPTGGWLRDDGFSSPSDAGSDSVVDLWVDGYARLERLLRWFLELAVS